MIAAVVLTVVPWASPALGSPGEESGFVRLINQERSARGLNTLEVYWDLVDDARAHSNVMRDADQIFHSSNLGSVTGGWSALGENVGVGPTVPDLHTAFMDSSGHRANVLGDWNYVGVGVTQTDLGYMFVTVVFMNGPAGLVSPPPAAAPQPPPPAAPAGPPDEPEPATPPNTTPASPVAPSDPGPEMVSPTAVRMIDHLLAGVPFPFAPD